MCCVFLYLISGLRVALAGMESVVLLLDIVGWNGTKIRSFA